MFCMYAFGQKTPKDGFAELARKITYLVGQLPLGLKVMGSHFRGVSKEQWPMEVPRLRANLNGGIETILMFSYDALCDEDKDLFLHIACFFNDMNLEKVEEYLAESFKNVSQRLHLLAERSLISIDGKYIRMHTLLAQLGKEIVRKQYVREPGQRQFLVDEKDICEVLTDSKAMTRSVIGLDYKDRLIVTENAFEGMSNLQFLRVRPYIGHSNTISSPGHLNIISPKLRYLNWPFFPMTCLPFITNLEFLVELNMYNSKLEKLWDGVKLLQNLKWMNLAWSINLKELPNLSTATSLEDLDLSDCSSLVELPSSIGNAINLKFLNFSECSSLVELPFSIGNLHKLERLYLQGCSKLKALPININMESLDVLYLSGCLLLKSFPEISTNIRELNLIGTSIKEVPLSIRSWSRLNELRMSYSENLKEFPYIHNNITRLHLMDTKIQELGRWVRGLSRLYKLVLKGMKNLVSLPQLPDTLSFVDAENCESLEKLDCSFCYPNITLNFGNCFKLNQEARDLIIHTSTLKYALLPGGEVPACFTYRASGSSVTVKLNHKPLRTLTKFKACILVINNDGNEAFGWEPMTVSCNITSKENALTARRSHERYLYPVLTEHIYVFNFETAEVTSTELVFKFKLNIHYLRETWEIKECGILHLLEHHVDYDYESFRGGDEEISERSRI